MSTSFTPLFQDWPRLWASPLSLFLLWLAVFWRELLHQHSFHKYWRDSKSQLREIIFNIWVQIRQRWVIGEIYWLTAPPCTMRPSPQYPKPLPVISGIPWVVLPCAHQDSSSVCPHWSVCCPRLPLPISTWIHCQSINPESPPAAGLRAPKLSCLCPICT